MNHTKLIVFYIVWCLADISNCTPIKTKNENSRNCDNSCKVGIDYGSGSNIENIEIGSRRSRQAVRDLGYIKQIFRRRRDLDASDTPVDEPSTLVDKSDIPLDEPNDADETTVGAPNVSDGTQNTPDSPADKPNTFDETLTFSTPGDVTVGTPNTSDDTSNKVDEIFDTIDVRLDTRDDTPNISDNTKNTADNIVGTSEEPLEEVLSTTIAGDFVENSPELDSKIPMIDPIAPTEFDEDDNNIIDERIIITPNTPDDTSTPNTSDGKEVGTPNTADDTSKTVEITSNTSSDSADAQEGPSEGFHVETPITSDFNESPITPELDNTMPTINSPSEDEGGKSVNGENISTSHNTLDDTSDESPIPNAPDDTAVGTVIASDETFSTLNSRSNILDDIPNVSHDNENTSGDIVDTSEEPSDDEGGKSVNDETISTPHDTLDVIPDKTPKPNSPDGTTVSTIIASDETLSSLNSRSNILDDIPNAAHHNENTSGDIVDTSEEPSDDEDGKSVNGETIRTLHDTLDGTPDKTPIPIAPDDTTVDTVIASDETLSSLNSRSSILDDIPNAAHDNENTSGDTVDTSEEPSDDEGGKSVNDKTISTPHDTLDVIPDETPKPNAKDGTTVGTIIASDETLSSLNSRSNILDDIPNAVEDNKNTSGDTVDTSEPSEGSPMTADFVENSPDNKMLTLDALKGNEVEDMESLVVEKLDESFNNENGESDTEERAITPNNSDDTPLGEPNPLDDTFSTLNSRSNTADETKSTSDDDILGEPADGIIYKPPTTTELVENPIPLDLENEMPASDTLKGNEFSDLKSLLKKLGESSNDKDDKSVIGEGTPNNSEDIPMSRVNSRSMNGELSNISDDTKRVPDDVVDASEERFDGVNRETSMTGDFVGQPIFTELDNRMSDDDGTSNTSDSTNETNTPDSTTVYTPNTSDDATPGSSDSIKNPIPPTMPTAKSTPPPISTLNPPKKNEFDATELLFGKNDDGESISTSSTNEDVNTPNTYNSVPVSTPNTFDDPFYAQISKSFISDVPNTSEDIDMTPYNTVGTAEETYGGVHFSPTTGDIVGTSLPPERENKIPRLNPPKRDEFDALELLFIEKLENFSKLQNGKNDDGEGISTPNTNEDIHVPNTSSGVPVSTLSTSDDSDDIKVTPDSTVDTAEESSEGVSFSPTTGDIAGNSVPPGSDNKMPTLNQPSRKEFNELESLFVGKLHELESSFFEKLSDSPNHENCKIALGKTTTVRNEFDELESLFLEKLHELEASFIGILNDFSNQRNEKIAIDESTSVRNEFDELELLFIKKLEEFSNQRNIKIASEQSFTDYTDNRDVQITPFHIEHQVEDNHDGNLDYIMKHILPELEEKMENIKYLPIYREAIGETDAEAENRLNNDKYESNISPCPCHITFDNDNVFQKQQELQNIEDDSELPIYPSYDSDDFRSNNFPFTDSPLTCDDLDYFY